MKHLLTLLFISLTCLANAEPNYIWSLIPRADYEANESDYITQMITLVQKRDWGDADDTNNILHQINYTAQKDGQDYALFGYAVCKMGEVLEDDWNDYTASVSGFHIIGKFGLTFIEDFWGFTLTTNAWRTTPIPFVPDNPQSNKKGKGFEIAYAIAEPYYSDKDTGSILVNIKNLPDTEANRAIVDTEFDKENYVLSTDTNIPVYVWSQTWDKDATVSRKDCKKAQQQGSANASCGILRSMDKDKVMEHYKVKEKKDKK